MNIQKYISRYFTVLSVMLMTLSLSSCLKNTDELIMISEPNKPEVFGSLADALLASKATLFKQALKRTGLDSLFNAGGSSYTVMAPTDAAMQAAGLSQLVIASLPADSLDKLVRYHILIGSLSDTALSEAALALRAATLWMLPPSPPVYNPSKPINPAYPLPLFIKYYSGHGLYVNDRLVSTETPAKAGNGYLYNVGQVIIQPFKSSVYDFIKSQPDLSMYDAALQIVDSINEENYNTSFNDPTDITIFKALGIFKSNATNGFTAFNNFTIFAPTNAAFAAAGFNTPDDIRNFAAIDFNTSLTYQSPMDSVLRRHVVFNRFNSSLLKSILLYSDLQFNSVGVNAGKLNNYTRSYYQGWDGGYFMKLRPLEYSASGGVPYIKWSSDPAKALVPVPADNPAAAYPNHFMGFNGVVFKVNTLFFRD